MPYSAVGHKEPGNRFQPSEGCAGYAVYDPLGQKIGTVQELFVNVGGEPEYIRVRTGLFGLKSILIPVWSVRVDQERRALVLE